MLIFCITFNVLFLIGKSIELMADVVSTCSSREDNNENLRAEVRERLCQKRADERHREDNRFQLQQMQMDASLTQTVKLQKY